MDALKKPKVSLNDDVLSLIFEINCDPFLESDALNNLRRYSQVSRAWRNLAFQSPGLWGRLIDLDELNRLNSRFWADEIVRRAGTTSFLWVKGTYIQREIVADWHKGPDGVNRMTRTSRPHFLSELLFTFVNANWKRVERFSVTIAPNSLDASRWSVLFSHPSPNLREFVLTGVTGGIGEHMGNVSIFSNDAPLLTRFVDSDAGFSIHNASWLPHIRSLTLPSHQTLQDSLLALQMTPLLEDLQFSIAGAKRPDDDIDQSMILSEPIELAFSKQVKVSASIKDCIDLLASVVLAPGCKLDVKCRSVRESPSSSACMDALFNLSKAFFPAGRSFELEIVIRIGFPEPDEVIWALMGHIPTHFSMEILIKGCPLTLNIAGSMGHINGTLPLALPDIVNVNALILDLRVTCKCSVHQRSGMEDFPDDYCQYFPVFALGLILRLASNTESLTCTADGVCHIAALQKMAHGGHTQPFLPLLQVLKVSAARDEDHIVKILLPFLRMRRAMNHTIARLDLTVGSLRIKDGQTLPDLIQMLDEFVGMEVLWRDAGSNTVRKHVCRIGKPKPGEK
ncbi:hypothetical protein CVT26_001815 [Gymnopilus dilepis]|uniref:F-box domain-containing protein n=1 Tax=Gymnopilus dilepis TaxID=231916 RepID=A0A409VRQ8_9AGAR|nr:hypothetical protein CVT26_001815 [Gymnopilus dilepis]